MGYTHYWTETKKPKAIPAKAVETIREIVNEAYNIGVVQLESDQPKPPIVNNREIRFNGVGRNGHETFYYGINDDYKNGDGNYFSFCKTAMKPYDKVVMKVLIVLDQYLGKSFRLSSDGFHDREGLQEWGKVIKEVEALEDKTK